MDAVIEKAIQQRDFYKAQVVKLEGFLATYFELSGGDASGKTPEAMIEAPKVKSARPRSGVGSDTLNACVDIISTHGSLSTRDLLPHVRARGIEVGGNDPLATLAARISQKGKLYALDGLWHLKEEFKNSAPAEDEATDTPTTETSAAPDRQTEEEANAPAVV